MVISSSLTIIFMRDRRNDFLQGGVRINGDTNTFNDIKVPPYAIRELKKRSKSIYGCRRTKILSTIYESDDETPKRIPITSDEKKDFNNSQRVSILDRIKKDDNDKVSRWMEQGYTNTSSVLQSMSSYSSEKDSGMPGSSLNKDGTPSDCGTSLFGGVCGREDEIYIDVKNLRV
uniref:Ovule protein n=1 Tax=Strongyloides venezuelensis TaxID=75913 RepID=A0A0K0F995_STRVS